jgi:dihydrofolate reductase
VATRRGSTLRDGFVPVADLDSFLAERVDADLWIIGGAKVYAETLPAVGELSLTRVQGDFGCTKFFPPFESTFQLVSDEPSPPVVDTPNIRFQRWRRDAGSGGRDHLA